MKLEWTHASMRTHWHQQFSVAPWLYTWDNVKLTLPYSLFTSFSFFFSTSFYLKFCLCIFVYPYLCTFQHFSSFLLVFSVSPSFSLCALSFQLCQSACHTVCDRSVQYTTTINAPSFLTSTLSLSSVLLCSMFRFFSARAEAFFFFFSGNKLFKL